MITLKRLRARNFKGLNDVDMIFPERGSILIEGHNEAGKSTLFEAVYVALYGDPLVGEEGRAKQDHLIQHSQASASVKLAFAVNEQDFLIERIFERGKLQQVNLVIGHPGTPLETISRIQAVNIRILKELHNLDGESLRNSCFVEQKELGRLEALSKKDRDDAIKKLLGLERLTSLADQFKFSRDQERELAQAEKRLNLAHAQEETREATAEEAAKKERLDAVHTVIALEYVADLEHQQAEAEEQRLIWHAREQEASERLQRCQAIRNQLPIREKVGQRITDARRARSAMTKAQEALSELDRIEQVELPAARARLAQIEQVAAALARKQDAWGAVDRAAEDLRSAKSKVDDLAQAEAHARNLEEQRAAAARQQDEASRLKDALAEAEREAQLSQQKANRAAARDALGSWVRLKGVERRLAESATQRSGLLGEQQTAASALVTARARTRRPVLLALGLSVLTLLALFAGVFWLPAFGIVALALVGAIAAWIWYARARSIVQSCSTVVQALATRLQEVEVYQQAAIQTGGDPAWLNQHERELRAVGFEAPDTMESGQVLLDQLWAELGPELETHQLREAAHKKQDDVIRLSEQAYQARQASARARQDLLAQGWQETSAQRSSTVSALSTPQQEVESLLRETSEVLALAAQILLAAKQAVVAKAASNPAGEFEAAQAKLRNATEVYRARDGEAQTLLQNAQLESASEVGPELGSVRARVKMLEQELTNRSEQLNEEAYQKATLTATLVDARDKLAGGLAVARAVGLVPTQLYLNDLPTLVPLQLHEGLLETALADTIRLLEEGLADLDEEGTRAKRDQAIREQGIIKNRVETLQEEIRETRQDIDATLFDRQIESPDAYTVSGVADRWPLVAQISSVEQDAIEAAYDLASKRLFAAQNRERELAENIQAVDLQLDIGECQQQVDELREEHDICRQAKALIDDAYARIAQRILPITERNMQPLLQQLTGGRYHDVRLTPEDGDGQTDQLDYRIRVWDKSAKRYVAKNLFSGGTRDQCSLALRLAFALATLPQELGVAPGFIFLDEPLSAFDAERAQALVALLTMGTIAEHFNQVVLISHQHAFDRAAFQYHVRMASGQVVESDLPKLEGEDEPARVPAIVTSKRRS